MALPVVQVGKGFGSFQNINYGKEWKNKTYYDVANAGNYGYLRWCLRNTFQRAPDPERFFIADSCLPHIHTALLRENLKATPWMESYTEPDNTGKMILNYKCYDEDKHEDIKSPDIEMKRCPNCKKILNYFCFSVGDHEKCKKCFYNSNSQFQSTNTFNKFKDNYLEDRIENSRPSTKRQNNSANRKGTSYNKYNDFHYSDK